VDSLCKVFRQPQKGKVKAIKNKLLEEERRGSEELVAENYQRLKHLFYSKHKKKPNRLRA
jgi:hypothetical protein